MELTTLLGYLSGLSFIRSDLDAYTLLRTGLLVHLLDALMCLLIASHRGRSKRIWTSAGLILGIWALGTLFLLPDKRK